MKTAAEMIALVQSRMRPDVSNFFDQQDYVDAYNDALDEIADATEIHEIWVNVKRRKWALYTDLRGVLPTTALRVTSIWNPTLGRWLDPTTPRELDLTNGRGWEDIVDVSRWWFMRGLWHLGTFPVPGDDISPIRVYCSALFPHVSLTGGLATGLTVAPDLHADAEAAIEEYMMCSLMADRGETEQALSHWSAYADVEKALKQRQSHRMSRDRTPRMGARR